MRQHPAKLVSESIPVHVNVIAKAPVAGRVKTRLSPPLTLEQAAFVAEAALIDTLTMVGDASVRERTVVLEGDPGAWLPPHLRVIAQRSGAFSERLGGAIADSFGEAALLGLAEDGGFWIIGTKLPIPGMFEGVEMSTAHTGEQQLARLASLGLRCAMLSVQRDVDVLVDALEVAHRAPETNFAAALASCVPSFGDLTSQGVSHG
jgi:glycosyltransferase A (GT-A) superfamily protein (DUF2064 family)